MDRYAAAKLADALGWALTPLKGKIPQLGEWQKQPKPSLEQVYEWLDCGYNLGLRTGAISGVMALDIDSAKGGKVPPGLPHTISVLTGSGGGHLYFRHIPGIGNSASKLAPHVDVRGEGGQVVYVGSIHPDTLRAYTWQVPPGELADLPEKYVAMLRARHVDMTAPIADSPDHMRLLLREVSAVRSAPEGTRNERLNKAAYTLGGCMDISEELAFSELLGAASLCGLPEREAKITVRSGFHAGRLIPLRARALTRLPLIESTTYVRRDTGEVLTLIMGSHYIGPEKWQHVTTDWFAESCIALLPDGLVCRRAGLPGQLQGPRGSMVFEPLSVDVARIVLDRHIRFARLKKPDEGESPAIHHEYAVRDTGAVFLAGASISEGVPILQAVVHWPTLLESGEITKPGWGGSGVYYDEPDALKGCEPIRDARTIDALLRDLVTDFPLASEGDIEAFWALLLTPLVRVAIKGPAPLFLVTSPQERTGKTKLVELVLGLTVLGQPIPATQLGGSPEEHDKRLISLLLSGASIVHLDNLAEYLDSPPLASLVTSHTYQARILGRSAMMSIPNHLTVVATGNNPKLSGELARRAVHVRLQTTVEDPARRTNYKHPDLPGWILEERTRLVGALVGMIEAWVKAGRPPGAVVLGGFEGWAKVVGGILAHHAARMGRASKLLQEAVAWIGEQDDRQADLKALVEIWGSQGGLAASATTVRDMGRELFGWLEGRTEKATQIAWGRMLSGSVGRVVGEYRICSKGSGSKRLYYLGKL